MKVKKGFPMRTENLRKSRQARGHDAGDGIAQQDCRERRAETRYAIANDRGRHSAHAGPARPGVLRANRFTGLTMYER